MVARALALFLLLPFLVRGDEIVFPPPAPPPGTPDEAFPAAKLDALGNFLNHIHFTHTAAQSPEVILDGDAITDGWQNAGRPVWKQMFGTIPMIDFAIYGDRTQNLLWRLSHGQLNDLHPKLVELMIGSENLGNNTPPEIVEGIKKIVAVYREKVPDAHILLLGVFPRGATSNDPLRAQVNQVNDALAKTSWDDHVTYLDINAKLLQADGSISTDVLGDFVRPTEKGFQIWADAVKPVFDQYCPATPGAPQQPDWIWPTPEQKAQIDAKLPTLSWPFPLNPPAGISTAIAEMPAASWFWRFDADKQLLKQGPYDFVMDGDSITDGWHNGGREVWNKRFGNIKVLDNGISGDGVQHVLWRVQHGDLDGIDPKLIMLLIGTNNCGADPKGVAQGIRKILDEFEKRTHAHILLLGIFPRNNLATDPLRAWARSVNAILSTYASDPRITYLDIGDKFLQPDGTLTQDIMPDFLHPSTKGYSIWADAIQPVTDKFFPNAAAK